MRALQILKCWQLIRKKIKKINVSGLELKSHQLVRDLEDAVLVPLGFTDEETEVQRETTRA